MARRLQPLTSEQWQAVCERIDAAEASREDLKAATKHLLALLQAKAPGHSVEVRITPFAAIQCIEGASHTRGTPPAVVEMDPETWIALGRGLIDWSHARVRASGERSDLTPLLPLM